MFKAPAAREPMHPYQLLSERERAARDILVKERRVAKRSGGWSALNATHRQRAMQAKADLRRYARDIAAAAEQSGWDKVNRKIRYEYINKLIGA
jgi:hypothetical protein